MIFFLIITFHPSDYTTLEYRESLNVTSLDIKQKHNYKGRNRKAWDRKAWDHKPFLS